MAQFARPDADLVVARQGTKLREHRRADLPHDRPSIPEVAMPNGLMWRWQAGPLGGSMSERTVDGVHWRLMAYPEGPGWSAVAYRDGRAVIHIPNLEDEEEARGAIMLTVNRASGLVTERRD